jgi:D-alanyl-D-alanine carboxypeptidase (penicillin-binding protein 5/6)
MKKVILAVIVVSAIIMINISSQGFHDSAYIPENSAVNFKENIAGNSLDLAAGKAILIDLNLGKILWQKNAQTRCYPASTTKILTALLALENCRLDEVVTVGDEANLAALSSSKAGIQYGQKLTVEQLLHCLLIPSGNDAAYVIAVHTARQMAHRPDLDEREAVNYFCRIMNKRARELGAVNSNFVNPDGFQHVEHYSTAYDLSLIARRP